MTASRPQRWRRLLLAGGAVALALSLVLGSVDFLLVRAGRFPAFSALTSAYRDGGSTRHDGFGYSLLRYHDLGGKRGPEIHFWFFPVPISGTYVVGR